MKEPQLSTNTIFHKKKLLYRETTKTYKFQNNLDVSRKPIVLFHNFPSASLSYNDIINVPLKNCIYFKLYRLFRFISEKPPTKSLTKYISFSILVMMLIVNGQITKNIPSN